MNDFPFQSVFSSEIKTLHSEDFDFNLALASLEKIGAFVPEVDSATNIDLLPIAFNACVANRVNRNNDVIDTKTAIDIYKILINFNCCFSINNIIVSIYSVSYASIKSDW